MIQVTLSFNTLAEATTALVAVQSALGFGNGPTAVSTSTGNAPAAKPAAPASAAPADKPASAKTQAAASPSPAPAPKADPAPAAAETPSLAGEEGYKVLQVAVFELAKLDKPAALAMAASFGVKHMKDLPEDRRPEALAAVKAKIAELTAAQNEVA